MHAPMGPRDPKLPFYVSTTNFCLDLPPQLQQAALISTRACWTLHLPGNLSCMHKGARSSQVQFKLRKASGRESNCYKYLGTRSELVWSIIHPWKNLGWQGLFSLICIISLAWRLRELGVFFCFWRWENRFLPLWIASRFPLLHWN